MEQFEIKSDVLGIIERIKAYNNNYSVYYNKKNKKYKLYLTENQFKPPIYCLTFSSETIDERMILEMLRSEIQNRKKILEEIENENALLLKQEQKKLLNQMENNLESKRNN